MSISARVGLGLGIVCAVSAGALGWQWSRIERLADAQRDLAQVILPATEAALNLLDLSDLIEIRLRKYEVTRDPEYAIAAQGASRRFDAGIAELANIAASGSRAPDVRALLRAWANSGLGAGLGAETSEDLAAAWADARIGTARLELQSLRHEISLVLRAVRDEGSRQVARSAAVTAQALNVSGAVLAMVLTVSAAVTLLTVRSINRPLRELLAATRAVADGRFSHRIETPSRTELAVLADHFNTMVCRLDELDRLKRDFLSNVSHEIKTPLVAMQESTRLLLDEVPGPLTERQRRIVEIQRQGQLRLRRMISDLLDMSRLDSGVMSYSFEEVDIATVVNQAIEVFEASASERDVRLEARVNLQRCAVRCDPDRITQVIHNLIDNALRFSPPGGTVTMRVDRPPAPGPQVAVQVSVSDQGIGVPDEHKQRVFERFYQVTAPGSGTPARSFGLGLAISQRIVTDHGGRIWVEDAPGGGAVFVVELPDGAAPALPVHAAGADGDEAP